MTLERDGFPPGVPCWIDIAQPDPMVAAAFYGALFGWEYEERMPAEAPGHYLVARLRGRDVAAVGSQLDGASPVPAWSTYIWVDSADEAAARVAGAGGAVLGEPFDVLDAGRMAVCADPAGAMFHLWQPGTHRGAQAVNEPGTWNWSTLSTSDVDASKSFYGAVFGWEADDTDFGGVMWRLPGYADFLEQFDPGLRQRHADFGSPAGFSDAIGWMMPVDPGQPPHWSVTFSVDDADAVVAEAVELGGAIVGTPVDNGVVRTAVLTDPQGAAFTVSHFRS